MFHVSCFTFLHFDYFPLPKINKGSKNSITRVVIIQENQNDNPKI